MKKVIFFVFMALVFVQAHALSFAQETSDNVNELVVALTPLIIFGVTALARTVGDFFVKNSWATLILVGGLSALAPIVQESLGSANGYWELVGWNLLAIVVSQLQRAFTGGNKKAHDRKVKRLNKS